MLADYIREYVKGECQNSDLGKGLYENHLILVAHYGLKLALKTGADPEIVELAAYLHDFSVILDINSLPVHEKKGVEIAETLLKQFHYPADKLEKVKSCILHHTSPDAVDNPTLEEACLSNADIISQIAKPDYWMTFYKTVLKSADGKNRYANRINHNWPLLMEAAREIVLDQYENARKMIKS